MNEIIQDVPENVLKIDMHRIGLPLSTKGFVSVCTTLTVFVILQYKLSNTFLAEGTIAVLAIIAYIAVRIFFLRSEYENDLGAIEITKGTIAFPKCLSVDRKQIIASRDNISYIRFYRVKRRGSGYFLTSIEIKLKNGALIYSNLFSSNLEPLKEALITKGYKFEEMVSPIYKKLLTIFIIIIAIGLAFFISKIMTLK